MKRWVAGLVMGLVVWCGAGRAFAADDKAIAFARASHLKRGVNLSLWWAQQGNYSLEKLQSQETLEDFQYIKQMGFDHVRLSINPEPMVQEANSGTIRADRLKLLHEKVQEITSTGLVVVLDMHPEQTWKHKVRESQGAQQFVEFWRMFARSFAASDPEKVYFELLNEPEVDDLLHWNGLVAKTVAAVRREAPKHTIIAAGGGWDNADNVLGMEPVADPNVIYTFHFYEPFWFTHQGATWSSANLVFLHGVPYPSSPEAVEPFLGEEPDEVSRYQLRMYGQDRWGAERVDAVMHSAAEWAAKRHVPLWMGEFGSYSEHSEPAARARWTTDVRTMAEKYGIGWCLWDYDTNPGFGLVKKTGGTRVADEGLAKALGVSR